MKFKCAFPKMKARTLPQVIVLQYWCSNSTSAGATYYKAGYIFIY